jgi:hypothetical protein
MYIAAGIEEGDMYNAPPMGIAGIVKALELERDRIDSAIAALSGGLAPNGRRGGRRRAVIANSATPRKPKRRLSAAGRKRISDAAKARWAKARKTGKKSLLR